MLKIGVRKTVMDNEFDIVQLESIFSNDFSSPIYAILASQYLKKNDIGRAYTVAKIGQEHHPDDISGKYILAKIHLLKNKIKKSKIILEEIINVFPLHLNARKLLIEVLKKQNSNKELEYHIAELQKYFPNEASLSSKINLSDEEKAKKEYGRKEAPSAYVDKEKSNIEINNNMATFTFVDILISQKHYSNALKALKVLENNGRDQSKINRMRDQINQKLEK